MTVLIVWWAIPLIELWPALVTLQKKVTFRDHTLDFTKPIDCHLLTLSVKHSSEASHDYGKIQNLNCGLNHNNCSLNEL